MKKLILASLAAMAMVGILYAAGEIIPVYIKADSTTAGAVNGTTVAATQSYGEVHKTVVTCTDTPATITYGGSGTNSVGGVKVYDMPEGRILVLGVTVKDMTVIPVAANGFSVTDGGDFSLGTTVAAGAALETTGVDLCPATSIDAVTNVTSAALAASAQFDGTTTAKDVYVNFLVDADDVTNNATLTFSATTEITWINLGDY